MEITKEHIALTNRKVHKGSTPFRATKYTPRSESDWTLPDGARINLANEAGTEKALEHIRYRGMKVLGEGSST